MGEGTKGCNRGAWSFSAMDPEQFDAVARRAVAIFAEEAIIPAQRSMEKHLQAKYIDTEPNLREPDPHSFSMPEADANTIAVSFFDNRISFFPHLGRGDETDDCYLVRAIAKFDEYLVQAEIPHTSERTHDRPDIRDL